MKQRENSYYYEYSMECQLCHQVMDHPPIRMAVKTPKIKTITGTTPLLEYQEALCCRWCVLEALAAIDESNPANPKAGWWHRAVLNGDLEPRGPGGNIPSMVDEEVGEPTPDGHEDSGRDS